MSIPSHGEYLANVIKPLAQAGGPQFGHETTGHPKLVPPGDVPAGKVEIGPAVEKK